MPDHNYFSNLIWQIADLFEVQLPVPSRDEQRLIVERVASETAKLEGVRSATETTVTLLKERRAALIAAAVSGQIDVGGAV